MLTTVQAGRALAAALVVFHHASTMFALPRYGNALMWGGWGELGRHGVDFFFVLSGFIIFSAHRADLGRPDRVGAYLWRRAIRIYPIYWVYLLGFLALIGLSLGRQEVPLSSANLLTAFSLIRFTSDPPPLQVAWTLFHELFFYLMFALLLLSRRVGVVAMILWLAVMLVYHQSRGAGVPTLFSVAFDLLNTEFLIGMAVAMLWGHIGIRMAWSAAFLGLMLLIAAAFGAHGGWITGFPESFAFALAFAVLLLAVVTLEREGRLAAPAWLGALGDASFTMYLIHTTILSALLRFALPKLEGWVVQPLIPVLFAAIAILISVPVYALAERPLLRLGRRVKWAGGRGRQAH